MLFLMLQFKSSGKPKEEFDVEWLLHEINMWHMTRQDRIPKTTIHLQYSTMYGVLNNTSLALVRCTL